MPEAARKWLESYDELKAITDSYGEIIKWVSPDEFIVVVEHLRRLLAKIAQMNLGLQGYQILLDQVRADNITLKRGVKVLRANMSRSILRRLDTQLGKQGGSDG